MGTLFARCFLLLLCLGLSLVSRSAIAVTLVSTSFTPIPGGDNVSTRALVQADGKIVVVGHARVGYRKFAVTRYNADGSLDTTFGSQGTTLLAIHRRDAEAWAAALQADGKFIVAGHVNYDGIDRMAVVRFDANGNVDPQFGVKAINAGPSHSRAMAVAIQPDGKVVVGGYSIGGSGKRVMTLARFNADGSTDASFGGGFYHSAEAVNGEMVTAIGFQSDGRIVAAGPGDGYVAMRRINTNGTVDPTWGSAANHSIRAGNDLVVLPDDKVAIVGTMPEGAISALAVLRMTAAGNVDNTFGLGNACASGPCPGVAAMSVGESASGFGLLRQPDGKLVVSGSTSLPGEGGSVALGRFNDDGSHDTTFGTNGRVSFHVANESGHGLARRADGRLVVAGLALARTMMGGVDIGAHHDSLAVAFTATGTLDTSFNGSGYRQLDLGSITATAEASATQFDGKLVVTGATIAEVHGPSAPRQGGFLARYLADGRLDTSFAGGGYITFPWPARAIAIRPGDDRIVIAGYSLSGGKPAMTFARYLPNGAPDNTFGTGGVFVIPPESLDEQINAIFLQDDGRIVGAGFRFDGGPTDSVVVRLTQSGALDTTFAGTGRKVVAMHSDADQMNAVLVHGDGKVLGAGMATVAPGRNAFAIARLNPDGALDTTFGTNGIATATFGSRNSRGYALFMSTPFKPVVGGAVANGSNDDFALARFNADGSLDASFGTEGMASNDFGGHDRIFAIQGFTDGTFLAAGQIGEGYGVAAYEQNGLLNTSYGFNGRFVAALNGTDDYANTINFVGTGSEYILAGSATGLVGLARLQGTATTQQRGTLLHLASSPNPSLTGQNVTFTATVTGSNGTPTGLVDFVHNGNIPVAGCTGVALTAAGQASCTTTFASTGTHTVFANYLGDATFRPSSGAREQVVNANHATVTVNLSSSANPSTFNQPVTFTASVTGGAGTATGTVSFRTSDVPLPGCHLIPLTGGSATCTTNGLAPGTHVIRVNYNGDATYQPASSQTLDQGVQGAPPEWPRAWSVTTTGTPPLLLNSPPAEVLVPGPRSALDASGNLFAIASTQAGNATCLVALKYNAANGAIAWRREVCSPAADTFGSAIAVDSAGNALVAGTVQGQLFVAKFSGASGATTWEQRIAPTGSGFNAGAALGIDASGNPRVLGSHGGILTVYGFNGSSGAPQWQRALDAGIGNAKIYAFAVDAAGNSAVSERHTIDIHDNVMDATTRIDASGAFSWRAAYPGTIHSVAFDPWGNVIVSALGGTRKLAAATGALLWTQPASGLLKVDAQGNVYITGLVFASFEQADSNVRTQKITAEGAHAWTHILVDPSRSGEGRAIDVDPAGNPVVAAFVGALQVQTIRYAASDGRILAMTTEAASGFRQLPHAVHTGPHGTFVFGELFDSSSRAGVFVLKYADAVPEPSAQEAMVRHFYRSILRRDPEAAGEQFWVSEAARIAALGADRNEIWYAMAQTFFASAEYAAFNRDNTGFVTDLYETFFDRAPDGDGLAYWTGLIAAGMPREVVLAGFMFSPEFAQFTRARFGDSSTRPEVNVVTDFYRGLLARLPDSGGFNYWVTRFREAQCQGSAAVYAEVEAIASAFANSPEYAARGRSNALFVSDLYNAYLRRGGDLDGVRYWIGQLDSGARTRDDVRRNFMSSPEFSGRMTAIVATGCFGG